MSIETIPIPRASVERKSQFSVEVSELVAWPDQRFIVSFAYNRYTDRWVWWLDHVGNRRLVPRSIATLEWEYSAWPYILFKFIAPTTRPTAVTAENLGRTVHLAVFPGPKGGEFLDDVEQSAAEFYAEQGIIIENGEVVNA